ncbi:MAG: hypothetical protein ACRECJ_11070, partial [Limisphaerales bacterium]
TQGLTLLWEKGFFKDWKTYSKVSERFAHDGYHFAPSELGMALKRARHLTRRGTRTNYEYIQKYPFVKDEE